MSSDASSSEPCAVAAIDVPILTSDGQEVVSTDETSTDESSDEVVPAANTTASTKRYNDVQTSDTSGKQHTRPVKRSKSLGSTRNGRAGRSNGDTGSSSSAGPSLARVAPGKLGEPQGFDTDSISRIIEQTKK